MNPEPLRLDKMLLIEEAPRVISIPGPTIPFVVTGSFPMPADIPVESVYPF